MNAPRKPATLADVIRDADAMVTEVDAEDVVGEPRVHVLVGPMTVGQFGTAREAHELAHEIRRCARKIARAAFNAGVLAGLRKADEIAAARRKATAERAPQTAPQKPRGPLVRDPAAAREAIATVRANDAQLTLTAPRKGVARKSRPVTAQNVRDAFATVRANAAAMKAGEPR